MLALLHSISLKKSKKRGLEFANFEALKRVSKQKVFSKQIFWFILHILLLLLIVLSIAGVTLWRTTSVGGINFVLAVDTSSSMLANDLFPSRIESAKGAAINFINILSEGDVGSEIAVISFSGSALSEIDFSGDYSDIKEVISEIKISDIPGTAIGEAIILGSNMLSIKEADDETIGSIILITDGQSNVGIDVPLAIKYANERNIVINTIGIGTTEGASFENTKTILKVDEKELQRIAEETGGLFFYTEDKVSFERAINVLASETKGKVGYNITPILYILILIVVFFEWLFTVTRYRIIP